MKFRIQAKLATCYALPLLLGKTQSLESRSFLRSATTEEQELFQQVGDGAESFLSSRQLEDIDCADIFNTDKQDGDDDDDEAEDAELNRLLLEKKRILCVDQDSTLISSPEDADEIIRTAFGNQQYLQLCSSVVFTTTLCITIRYPFPVSPPPTDGPNLRHVDQRYFDLTGLEMVDDKKTHSIPGSRSNR